MPTPLLGTYAAPQQPVVTEAERCARRTLEAAQRLLHPDQPPLSTTSTIELELARYVKAAYVPRKAVWADG